MANEKILVVDDEEHIVELIKYNLLSSGYDVITCNNGIDAVNLAMNERPNLILLDLMIPGKDGYDVCKDIRSKADIKNTSIIMLTAKSEEFDKILGLELGADDYITKPFSVRELLARVKAVLRRINVKEEQNDIVVFGELAANFEKREIRIKDNKIDLTLKEFELLEMLIKNRGKILRREMLLDKIWGYEYIGETRTVDVHIRYLRKKIEDDDKNPKFIETIRGVGYRFNPDL
ncbi:response regulator transcription factor [Clostridium sp. NSJ-6]|uniref:Stage 0 sporulation protein A homolog n=1 Tax=Clostridium hominis TaxID=2763036 RepID=A0ABR7DAL4_9CLOT|nr:response regulator transcription factor [Clostridium hominis]MBC5628427.1 response regulator transcription factor [Clostridium hominis]MDU2671106.1 response regulator transcription factor [Clostridium sp.]